MERYKKFCECQREILKNNKENKESKNSILSYDSLKKEEEILREKRRVFEIKLKEEIKRFGNLYDNQLIDSIKKFSDFIKNSTNEELKILKDVEIRW